LRSATHCICQSTASPVFEALQRQGAETDAIAVNLRWLRQCVREGRLLPVSPDDASW
jgi:hypothetical protein